MKRSIGILLGLCLGASAVAANKIKVNVLSPRTGAADISIQYRAGWPLAFELKANENKFLGTFVNFDTQGGNVGTYPSSGLRSWLVFADGDDCPYFDGRHNISSLCDPTDPEEYLEFTPGIDARGVVDQRGRNDLIAKLADPAGRPDWGGPNLSSVADGIGYGANDDVPGLVVLGDIGVTIVYNDFITTRDFCPDDGGPCVRSKLPILVEPWTRAFPEARHNLAGLMPNVAFELANERSRSTVVVSMVVPTHLFWPLVIKDPCLGDINSCGERFQVDGGPLVSGNGLMEPVITEIRAFVVNGDAPDIVEDCTGDDIVNAEDAECMGYDLLSRETVITVELRDLFFGPCDPNLDEQIGTSFRLIDIDGNNSELFEVCPGGTGGLTRPPR